METQKKSLRKIAIVAPSFRGADAIGNEISIMRTLIQGLGMECDVYAEQRGPAVAAFRAERLYELARLPDVGVIYEFSIGSKLIKILSDIHLPLMVRYQNVTPARYFINPTEKQARFACQWGREQIPIVARLARCLTAASEYSADELRDFASTKPVVLPLLRDYEALTTRLTNDRQIPSFLCNSAKKNILFVGRIVPNKAQHDLIELLYYAKKYVTPHVRLILVGSFFSEAYGEQILGFAASLGLKLSIINNANSGDPSLEKSDVVILQNVSDEVLAGVYRISDLFLSVSEHEGFFAPVVEAMFFDLPVMAHRASAVPETVGDGGLLFDKRDPREFLNHLRELFSPQSKLKDQLIEQGRKRREHFALKNVSTQFINIVREFAGI